MKNKLWRATLLLSLFSLLSCATSSRTKLVTNESIAKGAVAIVSTVPSESNNTRMRIKVKHLYPADKIHSGATNYVVWVKPEGSEIFQNSGALQVDNNLEAEYVTTIPFSTFHVMVTPETGNLIQNPSGPTIFEKRIFR